MAVAGEIEGVDLDFHLLAGMDESNIAVGYHGLDFELGLTRYHHRECLGRRHHASDRMDGELLNDAVDRCGHGLKLGSLLGLDLVLFEARGFLLCLG